MTIKTERQGRKTGDGSKTQRHKDTKTGDGSVSCGTVHCLVSWGCFFGFLSCLKKRKGYVRVKEKGDGIP